MKKLFGYSRKQFSTRQELVLWMIRLWSIIRDVGHLDVTSRLGGAIIFTKDCERPSNNKQSFERIKMRRVLGGHTMENSVTVLISIDQRSTWGNR